MLSRQNLRDRLLQEKLLFDGAFGTYYGTQYDTDELPERANTEQPQRVLQIHREYIEAGAQIIRTNTYASNTVMLHQDMGAVRENLKKGFELAVKAADGQAFVAADIGPIPYDNPQEKERARLEYMEICRTMLDEGAEVIVFETFAALEDILPAITMIGDSAFVIVQFAINQFGYSSAGLSARRLIEEAGACESIDAAGFNCGVGPGHMQRILQSITPTERLFVTALPNAGYPQNLSNRMIFSDQNVAYFAEKLSDIATDGADIVGGCCGTTPEYIRRLSEIVERTRQKRTQESAKEELRKEKPVSHAFYETANRKRNGKLIAVELAPPVGSDDEKLMDAAHLLEKSGVDVMTFPDSPSGRTRADSILMAEKVRRETGICVMPHICCRDKNAIAMRSQLLGAHINQIYNFLVITGDPIPSMVRSAVKSVFNFDSVGLMHIMSDMNEDQFAQSPISFGGAINQGRRNLDVEIGRVRKKMEAGAAFFLTQPVSTKEGARRLKLIKEETGARILCGIMPFVSLKNALFMKNEMTGIEVTEEVLARYRADMTREEGEAAGVALAKDVIAWTEDFVDGYYFSFPFNRVHMLEQIL